VVGLQPQGRAVKTGPSRRREPDPPHVPVLFRQSLDALSPRPGQTIVDCTVGLGGHGAAIIKALATKANHLPPAWAADPAAVKSRYLGIDLDPANLALARPALEREGRYFGVDVQLFNTNFAGIQQVISRASATDADHHGKSDHRVDAIFADVGVASTQIDDPARGFSYRRDGPLDMRMDPTRGQSAAALLRTINETDLAEALLELGDETDAPAIARLIVQRRAVEPINTTFQLMAIVCQARDFTIERAAHAKLHPAARTFQALRILVNRELANLERLLKVLPDVLVPGGVAAIISFHSGEDRLVKAAFRDGYRAGIYSAETRDPIIATDDECRANPRARSAKLRWARRA
jgi:16S rRNA (cytosine1402-N4)-methyltransferase